MDHHSSPTTSALSTQETELTTQLHLLQTLENISQIISKSDNIEEMLHNVLQEMLSILNCDRSWLLYPCDPNSPTWHVPMECTRPEWPGAGALEDLPMTADTANIFRRVLNSHSAIIFDHENDSELRDSPLTEQLSVQSQMLICLRPKVGKPWVLGIHYCREIHTFTLNEPALFEAISSRVSDALSTLLTLQDLTESEARFRVLVENAPEAIFVLDTDKQQLIQVNNKLTKLLGIPKDQLISMPWKQLIDEQKNTQEIFERCLSGETPCIEWEFKNGQVICEVRLIKLPASKQNLIRGSVINITKRKRAEIQMRKLSSALQQTGDAVAITDQNGVIEYVNAAFERITGYDNEAILGQNLNLLHSDKHPEEFYTDLWDTISSGKVFSDIFINLKRDGTLYYEEKTISPLKDDSGNITHYISSGRDISERMEIQERLQYLAHHDVLTDLPNRALFFDRLEQSIFHATRNKTILSVMFLDLDRFKIINDTLGHDTGDLVLKKVAKRLRKVLRASDTIARLGGDEFAILFENIDDLDSTKTIALNLVNTLSKPIITGQHELHVTTSIGISSFPTDGYDANSLLKNADIAMYQAKNLGKNTFQFYHKEMNEVADRHFTVEIQLRHALEQNEFQMHYQPKIDLKTMKLIGSEALIRWNNPKLGIISPADFIPLLEETGMIVPVSEWVLETACQDLKEWLDQGFKPGTVAINLSARQFSSPDIENKLIKIIKDSCVPTEMIEMEITEGLLIQNKNSAQRILQTFKDNNLTLALDDFGTGYSSLSYLKRFPIDIIKIDQSFVKELPGDEDDTALVNTIIAMAKALKLKTVAEGIENEDQLKHLRSQGCDIGQGYHISRPLEKTKFTEYLKKQ
ncbi:MAG: hypothetical protein ISEC1_P0379 [Thiomicrorhabdus sp.]|nr:MAG: hypothetical protein ISEC1_P0379 [Thiomicrorhabdus sp.]